MLFASKAEYSGQYDKDGIPLLNYHGRIGIQYNPIAIAQYGLGNYNLFLRTGDSAYKEKFILVADWLVSNLKQNNSGIWVWNHYFDWEYRTQLRAPWYSGLAQGQGISVLVRAFDITRDKKYLDSAERAFESFFYSIDDGGVVFIDTDGNPWIEEYLVEPPTHILNGFIWALWGVYDYYLTTRDRKAQSFFEQCITTLTKNIDRYDTGFWSLYELSSTKLKMLASPFYHRLHITQLSILHRLTGEKKFKEYEERWRGYQNNFFKRSLAFAYKGVFKLLYY